MAVDDHLLRDIGLTRMDVRATAWGLIGKRGSAGSQPDVADAKRRTGSRAERLATPSDAPARWMFAAAAALGLAVMLLTATVSRPSAAPPDGAADGESIRRGRYLVRIGGCNDCHTPGYMLANGEVPEERWLIGGQIGFNGTWGTTYAPNLRTYMSAITEDGWVDVARTMKTRPPMPWFNLRHMREEDLRAVYRYVRSLPPDSNAVPAYVPPGREPTTPYIVFMPQEPK